MRKHESLQGGFRVALTATLLTLLATLTLAQEGHPLHGSWSGDRLVDGQRSRVLLVMELQRDQAITGYVLENGKRSALRNVELDFRNWSVAFGIDGGYQVEGAIGELGSQTQRTITGTWTEGGRSGDFHVKIN